MMRNAPRMQKGMSPFIWLALIGLIGLVAVTTFKLIPLYIQDQAVAKVLEDVANDPETARQSPLRVWYDIDAKLSINSIYSVKKEHFTYRKQSGVITIALNYEVRKKLVGNVDLLVTFSRSATLKRTNE